MSLVFELGVLLAVACAVYGAWIIARGLGGEARAVNRRLGNRLALAAQTPTASAPGAFSAAVDRLLPALRRRLLAAKAPFTPSQTVLGSILLSGLLLSGALLAGWTPLASWLLALVGGMAGPALTISWLARRRRSKFSDQMPQAIELIARGLQAGHPVTTAMSVAAQQMSDPIGPEFALVMQEIGYGLDRDAALRNLMQRFPVPELRMFTASLEVTRETGGNLSEVFLNLADAMRAKGQLRKKVAAISAEGRMSFWVVSILPLGVMLALNLLNPDYYRAVAGDPLFWPLMSGPPILWAIGAFAIWRMISFRI
jgi:tight adherence protein B